MPIRLIALLVLVFGPLLVKSQDVLDNISKDVCPCLQELSPQAPKDSLNMKLGLCMLTHALPYQRELKKKHGVDLDQFDGPTGEKLGRLLAMKLVVNCPGFTELVVRLSEEEMPPPPAILDARTVYGTVQEVTPSQFLTITVKTDDGPSYEFLLLEHVTNIDQVSQDPGKARGFHAKWGYREREFFDPFTRTYKTYRVLLSMEP